VARPLALGAALAAALLAVSGAGGTPAQQTPKPSGTLTIRLIGPEPACFNSLDSRCAVPTLEPILGAVLMRPYETAPNFSQVPRLASVRFTRKRPFTLTYRIQPRARWSDGVPVTARDFKFTLNAIRKYGDTFDRSLHAVVRSAHVVNAKTLRVVLRPRSADWRNLFGHVLPAHVLSGVDLATAWVDGVDDPRTGRPIASGPFMIEDRERGSHLVLRRNPRYWGPHRAYLERIVVTFSAVASDPTQAIERGELDIAGGVPPESFRSVRQRGLRLFVEPSAGFEHLDLRVGPDGGHPALRSKLVRRAIAYGIDRAALARQVFLQLDRTPRPLDNALLLPQVPGYEANWSSYGYRPERALRLLSQAGCRRGADGVFVCGGARLSLRVLTTAGIPVRARAVEIIDTQLQRIGVEVEPIFVAPQVFLSQVLPTRVFDAALFSWVYVPGGTWKGVYGCRARQNFTGYCQRLVTADLDQADRILDGPQRARVLNRVDRQLAKDVPVIPLYQFVFSAASNTAVRNFVLSGASVFWNAENWWLAE
jgi:peptide/nickel transport system substrate-binding protein